MLEDIRLSRDAAKLRRWAHRMAGGLSVLGPSMLYDQCEELRALLRETRGWGDDVDTFASLSGAA
jgi:two-component system, NarL family, capsular synthesis sensor histidine kinase RcsC